MNKNSPKLLLIILGIGLLLTIGTWLDRLYICGPKAAHVSQLIESLGDSLVIREAWLLKSHPGQEINLISDTVQICDSIALREIQTMIRKSKLRHASRPMETWSVDLKIVFTNNDSLILLVRKISNDWIDTMTYFSSPGNNCPGDEVYYSLDMGTYLEQFVSFQGRPYE